MMRFKTKFQLLLSHKKLSVALLIGGVCLFSYGLLLPWLGFYGDDWGYIWLLFKGPGLREFLDRSREGFIPFYQFLGWLLGDEPVAWQLYMLYLRWVNTFLFWLILEKIFPKKSFFTIAAALLYAVYPGFLLNYAAVNISMFIVLLSAFYGSIIINLNTINAGKRQQVLTIPGLALALLNIALAEYFFFMEFIRPVLIFIHTHQSETNLRKAIRISIIHWLPYALLFIGSVIWRMVFQTRINEYYTLKLVEHFKLQPFNTILLQAKQMALDIWASGPGAWIYTIAPVRELANQHLPVWLYISIGILVSLVIFLISIQINKSHQRFEQNYWKSGMFWVGIGILWSLLSGWSIWLAELRMSENFATSRFSMPFMPGAVLVMVGLLIFVGNSRHLQRGLFAVLLGFSMVFQILIANSYRMDWNRQADFYQQLTRRFPSIKPGTTLVLSNNPSKTGEENALSAVFNFIYSEGNKSGVDYYIYFIPEKFQSDIGGFSSGKTVRKDHLIGEFSGNTDQIVVLALDDRNCIRTLYPNVDQRNARLSDFIRQMADFSQPESITLPPSDYAYSQWSELFGNRSSQDWCLAYQDADLASQQNRWSDVAAMTQFIKPEDYKHDWQKLMVFIEASIRTSKPDEAITLLKALPSIPPGERAVFCAISDNWLDLQPLKPEISDIVLPIRGNYGCK